MNPPNPNGPPCPNKARANHCERADAYEAYNYEVGIKPLSKKALGVQTLREDRERNRVHDHLLLGERRSDEQIYGRRPQRGSR